MTQRNQFLMLSLSMLFMMTGCSKTNPHPNDPLEGLNREIYGFNRALDKGVLRPVAYAYYKYTPKITQAGVHNFFGNLDAVPTVANDLLQYKVAYAAHDASRFLINSTLGLGGFLDVAQELGLEKRSEDFGQTLYHWGVEESPYLVLPIIGPTTIRDAAGIAVDTAFTPYAYIESDEWRYGFRAMELLDIRANLLRNENVLEAVGVDEYAFVRNAYLQRRTFSAYDGLVPFEKQDVDPFSEDEWLDEDEDSKPEKTSVKEKPVSKG